MKHFRIFLLLLLGLIASCTLSAHAMDRPLLFASSPDEREREQKFEAILQQRSHPDIAGQLGIAAQIVPFLSDPLWGLRVRATQSLGELEDPVAEAPLQKALELMRTESAFKVNIPELTIKLALGRISSRRLHGKAKVEAALSLVNLNWPEVVALSKEINAEEKNGPGMYSDGDEIIAFVIDLLYSMGKKGEPIGQLSQQLVLCDAQKVQLQATSLTTESEVKFLLQFLVPENVYVDAYKKYIPELTRHFVALGPPATAAVLARLQDMKQHPHNYYGTEPYLGYPGAFRNRMTYAPLFQVAAFTRDPRLLPLLKEFEQSDNKAVRQGATTARQAIEGFTPPASE